MRRQRQRFKIDLSNNERPYRAGHIIGMFKGLANGQVRILGIYEQEGYVIVDTKIGQEYAFRGQIESHGFNVEQLNHQQ